MRLTGTMKNAAVVPIAAGQLIPASGACVGIASKLPTVMIRPNPNRLALCVPIVWAKVAKNATAWVTLMDEQYWLIEWLVPGKNSISGRAYWARVGDLYLDYETAVADFRVALKQFEPGTVRLVRVEKVIVETN